MKLLTQLRMFPIFRIGSALITITACFSTAWATIIDDWNKQLSSCLKLEFKKDPNASIHPCKEKWESRRLRNDVVRKGNDLIITLADGGQKVLSNGCTEKCSVEDKPYYTYVGYFPSIAHHIVAVEDSLETASIHLVNSYSGVVSAIQGSPKFSLDNHSFVTASEDLYAGYYANGVEVWTYKYRRLTKQASFSLEKWGPKDPVWISQNLIEVKQMCPEIIISNGQSLATSIRKGTARLTLVKGVWSIAAKECPGS